MALLLAAGLISGCDAQPEVGRTALALSRENGSQLNGVRMNGPALNGVRMNGVRMNGVRMNGALLSGIRLEGTLLSGVLEDGTPRAGAELVGAEFSAALSNGTSIALRIDAVGAAPAPNDDLSVYEVSYASPDGSGWQPLCGVDEAGEPVGAFPMAGVWDEREGVPGGGSHRLDPGWITFACRGAAIAKCAEMGYRPWENVLRCQNGQCTGVSLESYHQACTRMVRADYCGNGEPWTVNGRAINVFDGLGLQTDTEGWAFEAEWRPDGARCMTRERVIKLEAELASLNIKVLPACLLAKLDLTCGQASHFASGTVLMNEFQTQYIGLSLLPR